MGAVCMAVIGAAAAPLIAIATHAAGHVMPESRQAEGFSLLDAAQSAAYATAGILLALLPIRWMLLAGTATGLLTLALAPAWLRWAPAFARDSSPDAGRLRPRPQRGRRTLDARHPYAGFQPGLTI